MGCGWWLHGACHVHPPHPFLPGPIMRKAPSSFLSQREKLFVCQELCVPSFWQGWFLLVLQFQGKRPLPGEGHADHPHHPGLFSITYIMLVTPFWEVPSSNIWLLFACLLFLEPLSSMKTGPSWVSLCFSGLQMLCDDHVVSSWGPEKASQMKVHLSLGKKPKRGDFAAGVVLWRARQASQPRQHQTFQRK